ncbi:hypothetical protein [Terribacillus saccharophilus]|uniref:hypothetical protein n=1 Tax=Terribacillus saccharophilus TaxID=361277 RepID=UPI000BA591F1|nr:hypothetical protein [Terribacillus saccharophilus]PAF19715.1 hypothetical protein CHH51_01235 [Terribacillus saccharophilus]
MNGYLALLEFKNDISKLSKLLDLQIKTDELDNHPEAVKDLNKLILETVDEIYGEFKSKIK